MATARASAADATEEQADNSPPAGHTLSTAYSQAASVAVAPEFVPGEPLVAGDWVVDPVRIDQAWSWQVLPDGLLFPAYLAGGRESRFALLTTYEQDEGWLWDITLGGHVGILRFGDNHVNWPNGWQLDIEGACFPRLDLENENDLVSVDFRFGIPLTRRVGRWEQKFGYYHLSSHLGDEFMESNPDIPRINYSRDVIVLALAYRPIDGIRLYGEAGWAFYTSGGSDPWEFQFGAEYSPIWPFVGFPGTPFAAVNTSIREDTNYSANVTLQGGWQWRGLTGHLFRMGLEYFNGKANQAQFFQTTEEQLSFGIYYDY